MIQQAIDFLRQHPEGVLAVTTHCARRTFVVNSLRLGIPAEVIMKWSGHSDFSAMKPYVAIVDKLKKENMAKYADLFEKEKKISQMKKKVVSLHLNFDTYKGQKLQPRCNRDVTE